MKVSGQNVRKNVMHIISGTFLGSDLFRRNWLFIVVLILIVLAHITHRYICIEKVSRIEKLQKELEDEKYKTLVISSDLTQISRQTQIEKMMKEKGLNLKQLSEPVYKIEE